MTDVFAHLPYRPCAGVMLLNPVGHVFVGQRLDSPPGTDAWQMPQGGIDPGEDAEVAAFRELHEETGVAPHLAEIVARSADTYLYDLPPELMGKMWKGKYRGQRQSWFLLRFLGSDADINIATEHQEFAAWKWIEPERLVDVIVPFKKELYANVVNEFSAHF
jgi:putative (di)nucleoside polyphosphate hydrolase